MAERSPLFLGLARPPKYLGLPVGYLVVLATGVVLPFIWTKSMVFFLIGLVAYPIFPLTEPLCFGLAVGSSRGKAISRSICRILRSRMTMSWSCAKATSWRPCALMV